VPGRGAVLAGLAAVLAAAAALALSRPPARPSGASVHPSAGAPDVRVADSRLGPILVDARGHTLYLFRSDHGTHSTCEQGCARVWPPAEVSAAPRAGRGVDASMLATTVRPGGARQLVYHGHPLYAMSADTRPGDTEGQGFLKAWYAVSPAGQGVDEPAGPPPSAYGS
jgi:predicted lipoprotein with Yx(FWY)xxD motif